MAGENVGATKWGSTCDDALSSTIHRHYYYDDLFLLLRGEVCGEVPMRA
jgi:hypothetical protein